MTTTVSPSPVTRRGAPPAVRFVAAFAGGLLAVLALGAGALYGYDRQFEGRILPGVRIGSVDVSGLAPGAATEVLTAAYGDLGRGELVVFVDGRETVVSYADLDRRLDVDGLVADALAVGRAGGPIERVIGEARTALRGVTLAPRVVFDAAELSRRIDAAAARHDREPEDASVAVSDKEITLSPGVDGSLADREQPRGQALAALGELDAPARVEVEIPVETVEPEITTAEAQQAKAAAERIARDISITAGDDKWTVKASTIRAWLRVAPTVDGRLVPVLDVTKIPAAVTKIAEDAKQSPRNATFLVGKNNRIVGVKASANGRRIEAGPTTEKLTEALLARGESRATDAVPATVTVLKPSLTTEEAEKTAPLMRKISSWTTYFPIGEKNGFGANIWIPAQDIDGYVVGPGEWFDFWKAVGPVTRARGYRSGGAIINGRTEPQGALAGGICSTSTTLFNAALRAGYQMGARRNHYYYIDRYPLGLDATVFKSGSGSVQTMRWRNDTKYPVLIRGYRIRKGAAGYVRFDLWSVPNGRRVSFSKPIVRNVRPAGDSVQYTRSLPAGRSQRIEYPVTGKDVWVTRTVRDGNGSVIHRETYYSHYARITGIVLVGTG